MISEIFEGTKIRQPFERSTANLFSPSPTYIDAAWGAGVHPSFPNWNVNNDKNVTKKPIVSSVFRFFQHFSLTTVINNNNDDQGLRALQNSVFVNQFKCIALEKLRVLVPKVAISDPRLTSIWTSCINQSRICYTIAQYQLKVPLSNGVNFFYLYLYSAERCYKNLRSAKGPAQCKSGPGNHMVSRRNHLLHHFRITMYLQLASFYAVKSFWKKLARGNAL